MDLHKGHETDVAVGTKCEAKTSVCRASVSGWLKAHPFSNSA